MAPWSFRVTVAAPIWRRESVLTFGTLEPRADQPQKPLHERGRLPKRRAEQHRHGHA
jgi:hypothetical protein